MKVEYAPTDEIVITPNTLGPYCSVFTNTQKTRIGIRLHRCYRKPTVWLDSKVTGPLIAALTQIQKKLPESPAVCDG